MGRRPVDVRPSRIRKEGGRYDADSFFANDYATPEAPPTSLK